MVEIAVALSIASKAFDFVKAAVDKGHEIQDLTASLSKFWDSKENILEAGIESEYTSIADKLFGGKSVESQAMEIAMARNKAYELEKQLRELFIYSGKGHVYEDMMKERRKIREARLAAAREKAARRKVLIDISIVVGFTLLTAFGIFLIISAVI